MPDFKDLRDIAKVGQKLHNAILKSRPDLVNKRVKYGCDLYVWGCQVKIGYCFAFPSVLHPDKDVEIKINRYFENWVIATTGEVVPLSLMSQFYEILKQYEK